MSQVPARSPLQDLAEAIGTLARLRAAHRMSPQLDTMINWLEAEMTYVLDPTSRIIQSPAKPKGPPKR